MHGLKPGVAVGKTRRVNLWFVSVGVEVYAPAHYCHWLCMVDVRQTGRSAVGQGSWGLGHAKRVGPSVQGGLEN